MNKSSFQNNRKLAKSDIAVILILLMFGGLLVSRLFLSLGMILFGINALRDVHPRDWIKNKWWLMGVAWVAMYAISGIWSDDKETWATFLQIKLPVLFLPLAFSNIPSFSNKQLQALTLGVGLMLFSGACYSISFLVLNYQHFIAEYNISHVIPTPVYGEYICFSITNSLFAFWCVYVFPKLEIKWAKAAIVLIAISLIAYNHVLASKSGLISFYVCLFGWSIYNVFARRNLVGIVVLFAIPVMMFLAVKYIPTLQQRKEHIIYTYYRFRANIRDGSEGDISRLISYDIGLRLLKQHPIGGTGMGDIVTEMDNGYAAWYPKVTERINKLIPHNQFLTVGVGCGLPAMLLFIIWVFMPLGTLRRNRDSVFFFCTWFALFIQLMIEPFLEGQFGLSVYLMFILLFWHSLQKTPRKTIF